MSKIMITGGAGFIGYFLAKKLSQNNNNEITIIDDLSRGRIDADLGRLLDKKNVKLIQGDLTERSLFSGLSKDYDYIYHLAAIIGVKNVIKNPDKILYVNAFSTLNLFEYAKSLKDIKKIFFSSTSEVYAGTMKHFGIDIPTDEKVHLTIEDISADRTTYALSKIYGEATSLVCGRRYGLAVTIGRYHNVYGPRMGYAHVIPETFVKINTSSTIDLPSESHTRAFCFIDDAIEFTIRACENTETASEVLHIGNSSEEICIRDLVIKISNILGKKISINELPDTPGSPARRCPDTSKIERLTGYKPTTRLDEGISKTYNWYKDKLTNPYE